MFIYRLEEVFNAIGKDVDRLLTERKKVRMRSGGKIELLARERERERNKEKKPAAQRSPTPAESWFLSSWQGGLLAGTAPGCPPGRVGGVLCTRVQGCQMSCLTYGENFALSDANYLPLPRKQQCAGWALIKQKRQRHRCSSPWQGAMLISIRGGGRRYHRTRRRAGKGSGVDGGTRKWL